MDTKLVHLYQCFSNKWKNWIKFWVSFEQQCDMSKLWDPIYLHFETRLHSSKMRTARLLTVSPSIHCAERGMPGPRGCLLWGCLVHGGCLVLGGGLLPGGGIPACTKADSPHEQNFWHTLLKILPCPKLCLRAVKKMTAGRHFSC